MIRTLVLAGSLATALQADDLSAVLNQVASYRYGDDPAAVRLLQEQAIKSAGLETAADIEKQILSGFPAAKTAAARDAICRALAVVGSDASVPVLAPLLREAETAEMARYALEQIPGKAATDALRSALAQSPPSAKPGVVASLGRRKDVSAVPALSALLASMDVQLADAAATSLGHIGTPDAAAALQKAKPTPAVNDALLEIAERSPTPAASGIYKSLSAEAVPEAVRIAALRGLARTDSKQAAPLLWAALAKETPLQAVAIRELAGIDPAALAQRMGELPSRGQVQILAALIDTRRDDVLPNLEKAAGSADAEVRAAALHGIGKLGGAKNIPMLAARAASTTGEEQAAARIALASVRGEDADRALVDAIDAAEPKVKIELIRAAGERGIASASEKLLQTAADPVRGVRSESIRALRETAGPAHVNALVALLIKTQDENAREELGRATAAAIRRSKAAPITELVSAYRSAGDPDVRSSLLGVLATVGNNDALPAVREALSSADPDVRRAAINALASWPSPEPLPDLLKIAQSSSDPAQQVLALRGYVTLVRLPSSRPASETAKLLEPAMSAARRPEEKKIVIAAAQRVVAPESLALVRAAADDPAVAAEAKAAIAALERSLTFRRN
jgi:HEAT repeat protein